MTKARKSIKAFNKVLLFSLFLLTSIMSSVLSQTNAGFAKQDEFSFNECPFSKLELPDNFVVHAAAGDSDRGLLPYPIEANGNAATQMSIVVNSPSYPVVLMLGAYESHVWNIQWTEGTEILGVLVSGFSHQAIAGLPHETPVVLSTEENGKQCGYFSSAPDDNDVIDRISGKIFGQKTETISYSNGSITPVGMPLLENERLLHSDDLTVESYLDYGAPRIGSLGIEDALKKGTLRRATEKDIEAFAAIFPKLKSYIISEEETYVVSDGFVYPAGLNFEFFLIPKGVSEPQSTPDGGFVFDAERMKCPEFMCEQF